MTPQRFRARATINLRLSERATVRFTVLQPSRGHRVGGKCLPTSTARRDCTRYVAIASLTRTLDAGVARVTIARRIGARTLSTGAYRLRAVATDVAGNASVPRTTRFSILKR